MLVSGRTFIIDGSNVVHAIFGPFQDHAEMGGHEREFVDGLADWAERQPGVEVEAVFDGGWRTTGDRSPRVKVMFADSGSADALILERVRALRFYRRKVTVVTWDRDLADAARTEEARIVDPETLWGWVCGK